MVYNALRRLGTAFNLVYAGTPVSLYSRQSVISTITPRAPFQAPLYLFMEQSAKESTAHVDILHVITVQLPR
jgi:hypothetical protein